MSRRFPRERRKLSSRVVCSRLRRPNRPTENSPSRVVPHDAQCSRVTANSPEQTGQVEMTSWAMGLLVYFVVHIVTLPFRIVNVDFLSVTDSGPIATDAGRNCDGLDRRDLIQSKRS